MVFALARISATTLFFKLAKSFALLFLFVELLNAFWISLILFLAKSNLAFASFNTLSISALLEFDSCSFCFKSLISAVLLWISLTFACSSFDLLSSSNFWFSISTLFSAKIALLTSSNLSLTSLSLVCNSLIKLPLSLPILIELVLNLFNSSSNFSSWALNGFTSVYLFINTSFEVKTTLLKLLHS
ncbi:hypothetical protein [Mycoplasma hafezii]|uniref:hypothetical protein n=1 Tax=Mycoplasma hafezii TaxID=525886 RepID=UPI003CF44C7C